MILKYPAKHLVSVIAGLFPFSHFFFFAQNKGGPGPSPRSATAWVLNEILDHRSFFSLGWYVNEFIQIISFFRTKLHFKLRCETCVGIVLCYSYQACCLLYYLGEINSGIHMYQCTSLPLNLYTSVFRCGSGSGSEQKFWRIDGFGEKRNGSADLHTLIYSPPPPPSNRNAFLLPIVSPLFNF